MDLGKSAVNTMQEEIRRENKMYHIAFATVTLYDLSKRQSLKGVICVWNGVSNTIIPQNVP